MIYDMIQCFAESCSQTAMIGPLNMPVGTSLLFLGTLSLVRATTQDLRKYGLCTITVIGCGCFLYPSSCDVHPDVQHCKKMYVSRRYTDVEVFDVTARNAHRV
jgi:hypothetical protein